MLCRSRSPGDLYMDEARIERLPRMPALQADLTRVIAGLPWRTGPGWR